MGFFKSLFTTRVNQIDAKYADLVNNDMAEKLWLAERTIKELRGMLEKEKRAHHRTRNVYSNVINIIRRKMIDIDFIISREAKKYDRAQEAKQCSKA